MGRTGKLIDADSAPSEVLRILEEVERTLDPADPTSEWLRRDVAAHRETIRAGHLDGAIWVGPKDEGAALAVWSPHSGAGRRVGPYLAEGYRTPTTLAAFVRALDATGPIRLLGGPIAGLSDAAVTSVLEPLGFRAVERTDMTFPETTPVPFVPESTEYPIRGLTLEDRPRIARLLERAYSDVRSIGGSSPRASIPPATRTRPPPTSWATASAGGDRMRRTASRWRDASSPPRS